MARATADRQRAEMAKRKSDEMLTKELALKKGTQRRIPLLRKTHDRNECVCRGRV